MRIIIYGLNYHPELTGIGKYSGEMAEWLSSQGHEVLVVTAPPYYPSWRISPGYSSWKYKVEKIKGAKVIRCPLWVPGAVTGIRRIFHLISFAASSFPVVFVKSLSWRPDVIFVVEPTFFCAPAACISAILARSNSWLHIQDLEIDAAFDMRIVKAPFMKLLVGRVEQLVMRRFDTVSVISEEMFKKVIDKGVDIKRSYVFRNWVDINGIYPISSSQRLKQEYSIPEGKLVLLYSGNMGEKQGLDIIIDAAQLLIDNDKLLFVLCGDGVIRKRLVKKAKGLKNVLFLPLQPAERLNDLLNLADIHLLPQRRDAQDILMPSKLLGMLSSGRPVIATVNPDCEIARALEGRGMIVPPGDLASLKAAVLLLADRPDLRSIYGLHARAYAVTHWSKDMILKSFESELVQRTS